jgi:hypothetical protein
MSLIEPTTISRLAGRYIGSPEEVVPAGSRREARDGSVLWWGKADTPGPPQVVSAGLPTRITVAVSPVRPGHTVAVEYRSNGGPVRQTIALPVPGAHNAPARLFRALLPGQPRASGLPTGPPLRRTADFAPPHRVKKLAWLNRAQCLGLVRVDTKAMRIEADVYVVSVGGRKHAG